LLAATGGTSRQLRDVVLSMAIVLGILASVAGVVFGIGFVLIGQPFLERVNGARFGQFDVRLFDIGVIALTGLGAAVLSAIIPARMAARMDVTAALNGRRDANSIKRRWKMPATGSVLIAAGVAMAAYGATHRNIDLVLGGAMTAELGLVLLTSILVGIVGMSARWLPLGPRLALRDAVRNRTRTAPVVAAIMAAVAGSFAMSMYVSTYEVNDRETYTSEFPKGHVSVALDPSRPNEVDTVKSILSAALPVGDMGTVAAIGEKGCSLEQGTCNSSASVIRVGDNACPTSSITAVTNRQIAGLVNDERCQQHGRLFGSSTNVVVGDEGFARALFGDHGDEAARALAAGQALATNRFDVSDGVARLGFSTHTGQNEGPVRTVDVPATSFPIADRTSPPAIIISKETLTKLGYEPLPAYQLIADTTRMPTDAEEDRARDALANSSVLSYISVERGYESSFGIGLLVLAIGTAVLALLATGIAAGLALADGHADQSTLAAIGAGPRIRRFSSAFQAIVVALMGVGLGLFAGTLPGAGVAYIARYRDLGADLTVHLDVPWLDIIPWSTVAMLLLAVPCVAGAFAWLFTRSRIPLTRRAD
jgi:putative ABC transport system permease protein